MEKEFDFLSNKALCVFNDTEPVVVKYNGKTVKNLSAEIEKQDTTENSITYQSEYKSNLVNMSVEGNTEQDGTPTIEQPVPIQNSSNVEVELRGINLANMYAYKPYDAAYKSTITTLENGDVQIDGGAAYTDIWTGSTGYSNASYVEGKNPLLKVGTYTLSYRCVTASYFCSLISKETNTSVKFISSFNSIEDIRYTTFSIDEECYLRFGKQTGTGCIFGDLSLVEGSDVLPYEPYFEPTTVQIPNEVTLADGTVVPLRFARLGTVNNVAINKADTLTIDKIGNKVTYTQYLDLYKPQAPYVAALNIYPNGQYGGVGMYFKTTMLQKGTRFRGICTHGGKVGGYSALDIWMGVKNAVVYWLGIVSKLGYDSDWVDKLNPTAEENAIAKEKMNTYFAEQEANGTPFEVLYELPTPIEYDLTNTDLGQQLLTFAKSTQNATNTITVNSALPISKLDVGYAIWGGRDES